MVFEDAQWIDPTSRELLDLMIERVRILRVLLILTFRPEFEPSWTGQEQVNVLALNRLDRRDRIALVEQTAGGKSLPYEVVAQIADRADGVPLFVEELTKSVLESGVLREEADRYVLDRALPAFAIPTSLRCCIPFPAFRRVSCTGLSPASSPPSWCSSAARRLMRSIASSTGWCRTWCTTPCCVLRESSCTPRSPRRWKPILPR